MSFNFLLPTLTFVNIGPQVTLQRLKLWWPAAVNIIVRWDASPASAGFPSPYSESCWRALMMAYHMDSLHAVLRTACCEACCMKA